MTDNTAPTPGQSSLFALPARRAREAFEAARWDDDVKTDAEMWEAAMEAAYPSMRDEYVRLSLERDDARSERDQASASYQRVTTERDQLAEAVTALAVEWEGEADAEDIDAANEPARDSRAAMQAEAVMQRDCAAALRKLATS